LGTGGGRDTHQQQHHQRRSHVSANLGGAIKNCNNDSHLKVVDCLFEGNSASSEQTGGGIYSWSANTEISHCVFNGNTAGGGGGISCTGPKISISNSLFNGNSAYAPSYGTRGDGNGYSTCAPSCGTRGGAIGIWCSNNTSITNCTIYGNQASCKGGGIYCENSTVTIMNSIIWGNSLGSCNKQIFPLCSTMNVDYCDIELGPNETPWGAHCIYQNPGFIDPANGDFHLSGISPCIDTGNNTATGIPETDLEGNPRIIGGTVDMGVYEFIY
jgi:predicted outer membrane repeat protein